MALKNADWVVGIRHPHKVHSDHVAKQSEIIMSLEPTTVRGMYLVLNRQDRAHDEGRSAAATITLCCAGIQGRHLGTVKVASPAIIRTHGLDKDTTSSKMDVIWIHLEQLVVN